MENSENPFTRAILHLESSGVDYVIVGGFAVVMHGCNRFTPDLNVMVSHSDTEKLATLFECLLGEEFIATTDSDVAKFYDEEEREKLFDGGKRWFFSFRNLDSPSFSLDLFLKFPVPFQQVHQQRKELVFDDQKFSVCAYDDLIAMKSMAGRGQDKADIGALKIILQIEEMKNAGKSNEEILALGSNDAEVEQIEGFIRFLSLSPKEKLDWLNEMLNHLGKFCVA